MCVYVFFSHACFPFSPFSLIIFKHSSGKTTQIPQFILDHETSKGGLNAYHVNIIITQPRRVSAVSVAKRVSQERNDKIGGIVGYHVRFDVRRSKDTRVLFCKLTSLLYNDFI